MKTNIFYGLCLLFVISCSSGKKGDSSADTKSEKVAVPYAGFWLSEEYFNRIGKSKSPQASQDESRFLIIPDSTSKPAMMIYNFHEGGSELTIIKNGAAFELREINGDSIVALGDTLEPVSSDRLKVQGVVFVKINPDTVDGEHRILEELLFKGNYINEKGKQIEFRKDGSVLGLDSIRYYNPLTDYYDQGLQIDQVDLSVTKGRSNRYAFKFKGDTLELYEVKCLTIDPTSKMCAEVDFGKLLERMWRR